ncbi:MAG: RHS repeat-associated core domain-containing protein [Streptosporangiaceae bacterium]
MLTPTSLPGGRPRRRSRLLPGGIAVLVGVFVAASQPAIPADAAGPRTTIPAVTYAYNAAGELATVTTSAGTRAYRYDAEGNVVSISGASSGSAGTLAVPRRSASAVPVITAARPAFALPGTPITITGRGFSALAGQDIVHIGSLAAQVNRASVTRLRVIAPPGPGGTVRVTSPGGTARGPSIRITTPRLGTGSPQGRDTHPLRAQPGVTALSGLVETSNGRPLAGVAIIVAAVSGSSQRHTVTGANGQFLISGLIPGQHQLIISGNGVAGPSYGVYAEPVELPGGSTTVLPWVTYLTPLDSSHAVAITSPASHEVIVSTPRIPGLEIEVPRGTVIRDRNGHVVTKLSITPLEVGRTPYPLAPGMQPGFFTLQPGDATVTGPGLRVIYPNGTGQPAGTAIPYFVDSPDWAGNGWWRYGTGHVTADGRQITPAPGVSWHKISLGGYGTNPPPPNGPPPCPGSPPPGSGGGGGGSGGAPPTPPDACPADPVSAASGLMLSQTTDLSLSDVESLSLVRTYRQLDDTVRDFGIGMSSSFNYYIVAAANGDFDLYSPDGGSLAYQPTGTTGLYQAVGSPTLFVGSTLTWNSGDPDGPFTVNLADGSMLSFDNPAYLTKITDRFGNSITINRTEFEPVPAGGQIQTITTPDGEWLKFSYANCVASSPGTVCVSQVQDNSGRTLSYTYDSNGRLLTVTNPAGGVTRYSWAACANSMTCTELLRTTDPDGHVTANTYDPATGRVTSQTDGVGSTWNFSYLTSSSGQITQTDVQDPRGIQDDYVFNADGEATSVTDAAGTSSAQHTTATYSPTTNLLTSETDPLGRTTDYTYDAYGDVLSLTKLAGTSSAVTYSATYDPVYHRMTNFTDPLGNTTTLAYNDASHTVTATDPAGHQSLLAFNDEGQLIQVTNAQGQSTYLSYLYGQLVAEANPLGEATGTYYNAIGQPLQITDAEGNTTDDSWSPLGQLSSQTNPLGAVTSYGYDGDGNLTSITDANGNKTTFAYNGDSELVKQTDPLGKSGSHTYDADGNVASYTDANGKTDAFTHDDFGDVTSAVYGSGGSSPITVTSSYDAADRLTKAVDSATGTYTLSYDGLNDILTQAGPQGTVTSTYNTDGLPISLSVPGQSTATYTYNADKMLTGVTRGTATVSLGYNAEEDQDSLTLPDGIVRTAAYNADNQPTALTFTDGSTTVGTVDFGYTADGQVASESGSLASAQLPTAVTSNTYNADNELTSSGGTAYSYDSDGDLLSNGTDTFSWNAAHQLSSVSGGVSAAFTYDPFGQQASATVGGSTTSYLYDGTAWDANVVQEEQSGTPTANLLTGGTGQIFQLTTPSGANSSFLPGLLGSTTALANSSGSITTSYSYSPGGAATVTGAASPNTFEYNATQNEGTGLYPMGVRYYDPASGTFISQDPTGFHGGVTDLYDYAQNDPVDNSDPTGCGQCSLSNVQAAPGKLFPQPEFYGSLAGATIVTVLGILFPPVGVVEALSFGTVLVIATIGGGLIGLACNVS